MIVFGIVLLVAGYVLAIPILWTISAQNTTMTACRYSPGQQPENQPEHPTDLGCAAELGHYRVGAGHNAMGQCRHGGMGRFSQWKHARR